MKQYMQDRLIAGAGLLLVALCWWITTEYPEESSFFPQVCLVGIAVLLALLGLESLRTERSLKRSGKEGQQSIVMNWGPFLLVTAALVIYAIAMVVLGFYLSSALFLTVVGLLWGGVKKSTVCIFTVLFLIFLYVCFTILFNVPLPTGIAR